MEQKVFRGRHSSLRLDEMMEKLHITKPLVVAKARNFPLVKCGFCSFSGYHANPDFSASGEGKTAFLEGKCDGIISIGGGSAIDTAKAVKALLMSRDSDCALRGELEDDREIPLLAIPTTAGSGSEATATAVVYVDGRKHSIVSDRILPDGVILDSSLLDSLPREVKIASAMDALCQGMESYISKNATEDSQVLAYLGVLGVIDNIRSYLDGEIRAADQMIDASYHSGKAIRLTRAAAAHAMSYPLTTELGIPHGIACALTFPAIWDMMVNDENALPSMMDLAAKMRLGSEYLVSRLIRGMIYDFGIDYKEKITDSLLEKLTDMVNPDSLKGNPMSMNHSQVKMAYAASLYRPSESERQLCLDIWHYYGQEEE